MQNYRIDIRSSLCLIFFYFPYIRPRFHRISLYHSHNTKVWELAISHLNVDSFDCYNQIQGAKRINNEYILVDIEISFHSIMSAIERFDMYGFRYPIVELLVHYNYLSSPNQKAILNCFSHTI